MSKIPTVKEVQVGYGFKEALYGGKIGNLKITVFYNNSKERGWKNKFQDTAQRFAAVLGVEEDSEKIRT